MPVDPGFATFKGKQLGQRALGMLVSLGMTKMAVSEVTKLTMVTILTKLTLVTILTMVTMTTMVTTLAEVIRMTN